MNHYLQIDFIRGKGYVWSCTCGDVAGSGPTEEACQVSFDRHLIKLTFLGRL